MQFDTSYFDAGIDRIGTNSEKWDDEAICPKGHVPLWVADMDFACAPAITQALAERAQHASYGYTFAGPEDTGAVRAFWQRRHGVQLADEEVGLLPSVVSGLRVCVDVLSKPGEGVIIQSPVYGPFFASVRDQDRQVLDAPLLRGTDGRYTMDLDRVEQHLKAGARLMILCNPQNPVGRCWQREELEALSALLNRYGCALVSDEIHADFVYKPHRFVSLLTLDSPPQQLVVLAAASKTFNVAGLQQSSLLCRDRALMDSMSAALNRHGVMAGNIFALAATRAAYTACDDWLDGLIAYLDGSREVLREALARLLPEAKLTPIEATYLAWVDMRAYGLTNEALYQRCMEAGVVPTNGTFFGQESGEGFLRINFGCPRSQLLAGLERLAKAVKG
ncbi:MAG: putative C-S lyase [Clostridiales bacterium]|nr:putative C-S lyase [Clostridiales bacterium]